MSRDVSTLLVLLTFLLEVHGDAAIINPIICFIPVHFVILSSQRVLWFSLHRGSELKSCLYRPTISFSVQLPSLRNVSIVRDFSLVITSLRWILAVSNFSFILRVNYATMSILESYSPQCRQFIGHY